MNPEPHFDNDLVIVRFDARINGRPVRIEVDRELIEDHQNLESMSPEERLKFAKRNLSQIKANVSCYLFADPDTTSVRLGAEQLANCD